MRNPRFWRNVALGFVASGAIAAPAAFLLPEAMANDALRGGLFVYGLMAILFGGFIAYFRQAQVRAAESLARGEDVLARWRIDTDTWKEFAGVEAQLNPGPGFVRNELVIPDDDAANGIEVIIGKAAVQIGDSIHVLPRRGTPEVTHAALGVSDTGLLYVEFHLYYPGGGQGASGVPQSSIRTVLRFPVAKGSERGAADAVAFYDSGRPGEADFFHGPGDGTDPEDLSKCYLCGYETHKLVSHCPQCGANMQSKRWSRRFGWGLIVCGIILTALIGAVLYYTAPLMLRPGVEINGASFSGTPAQGLFIFGILGVVATFGVTTMLYGVWQVRTGRRDRRVIAFILGLAGLLWLIAAVISYTD